MDWWQETGPNPSDLDVAASVAGQLRGRAQQAGWAVDPVRWARDVLGVHLWSKQREIADSLANHKRTVVASCHGTGKALSLDTPIPVPGGTTVSMGDISPGDRVLGSDGSQVKVQATTGAHLADAYQVVLEGPDGRTEITASGDHLWPVMRLRDLSRARLKCGRSGMAVHTGLWHHRTKNLTTKEIRKLLTGKHTLYIPAKIPRVDTGLKWEPDEWMRSLLVQRGCTDVAGRAALAWIGHHGDAVPAEVHLVRGWVEERGGHTSLHQRRDGGARIWTLALSGGRTPSFLPSEDDRAVASTTRLPGRGGNGEPGWRVVSVIPVGQREVQCIQVDAPDHLYLCGEEEIPTHNSMIASVLACWWVCTRPVGEAMVVSSAPTYAQVNKILWEEIRKHHSTAQLGGYPMVGRVTQGDEWKADDGKILAFGRKPAQGDRHAFQGIHRRYVLVILDECCGIPEEIWTGAEAITTNNGCRILAIGNPDDRNTEFGKAYLSRETAQDWSRIAVPADSTPNFTGEPVPALLNEVLVSKAWCEERLRNWGKNDPRYISKVLARFPEQSQSSLFSPSLINSAVEDVPARQQGQVLRLGVDVARFGTDDTVVATHSGVTARIEDQWSGVDTVSSAHRVLRIAEDLKAQLKSSWVEIRVDAVGLGAGVVDTLNARVALLREPWFSVYEMHGSASPPQDVGGSVHGYGNARAFWFDQLRQAMRNGSVRVEEHQGVRDDLAIVLYQFRNGKLFIISKEEMKQKYGRSPDLADALAYATAPVAGGLETGSTVSEDASTLAEQMDDMEDIRELSIAPY